MWKTYRILFQDYHNPIRIFAESKATAVWNHTATMIGGTLLNSAITS
jgi:hypothetical protein